MEEIVQAILQAQTDPSSVKKPCVRTPKPLVSEPVKEKEMPPRKKPGPVPKAKPAPPAPAESPPKIRAVETLDPPLSVSTVVRIRVHKLFVNDTWYYLDPTTQAVYAYEDTRPGERIGLWNPETKILTRTTEA